MIYAGSPSSVEASEQVATFTPTKDNVAPQSIELRVYAEDYLPGRPRSYSVPYIVHILSETDHAVWLTRQIEVWVRQCLETYDREQQLYNANHRDSTRMLDQSRSGRAATDYQSGAKTLADEQFSLAEAAEALVRALSVLPDGERLFGKEIGRFVREWRSCICGGVQGEKKGGKHLSYP